MVCTYIEICNINITKEHYDNYCTTDGKECWRHKNLSTVRKHPKEWHKGGDM